MCGFVVVDCFVFCALKFPEPYLCNVLGVDRGLDRFSRQIRVPGSLPLATSLAQRRLENQPETRKVPKWNGAPPRNPPIQSHGGSFFTQWAPSLGTALTQSLRCLVAPILFPPFLVGGWPRS